MGTFSFFRVGAIALGAGALLGLAEPAAASGPLERLVQYIQHPTDPRVVVLRFGVASEGLLFSRDGGRSFQALCTNAIDGKLDRISPAGSPYVAPAVMDGDGRLIIASSDALWSDDGTGCRWTKQAAFEGRWVTGLALDPADPKQVLAVANMAVGEGDALEVRAQLLRRSAAGSWTVEGTLKPTVPGLRSYGGDLVASMSASGPTLYSTVSFASGALATQEAASIVVSTDGGKSWSSRGDLPPAYPELRLLAADPQRPTHLLASSPTRDGDQLLLSEDGGLTFRPYLKLHELSGVAFAPSGQVFIGDAGDNTSLERTGGVFTASALGEALAPIPQPPSANPATDCVGYDPGESALRICRFHRYGTLSTTTGAFSQRVQMEGVQGLLRCEGRDVAAVCQEQFNDGVSWCCTGHYPFTGFCGEYDVKVASGRPVACGLSGRQADLEAGRGPQISAGASP